MNRRDGLISVIDALHAEIAAMKANDVSALDQATQRKLVAIDALAAIDGGGLEPDVRELAEETGVTAQHWEPLGEYLPAPGLMTERVYLYMALRIVKGAATPESDEELELQWVPLEEAMRMVIDGRLDDGKTALGLMRAHGRLQP